MNETETVPDETAGILYAGAAYSLWGIVPLYWRLLDGVGPIELTIHRVLWCALFVGAVTLARGRLARLMAIFATRRTLGALALSSVLIAANWTVYIWCVSTRHLVDAALGYYLTPLLSIALGVILLGERISRFRLAALVLATVAVGVQAFELGHVPWIALALAFSFGFYGFVRKQTVVDALDGLTVETWLLFPLTLGCVGFWAFQGTGAFPSTSLSRDALLIGAGPLTAVPLVMFAAGARRVRMTTLGFLQYLSPSITLLVATLLLGEHFTRTDAITFGCVWTALVLVGIEGQVVRSAARRAV
jgi:chloramphenicol-sensitive protein RarD